MIADRSWSKDQTVPGTPARAGWAGDLTRSGVRLRGRLMERRRELLERTHAPGSRTTPATHPTRGRST